MLTHQKLKVCEGVRFYSFVLIYEKVLGFKGKKNLKSHEGVICYWKNICSLLKLFGVFEKVEG